MAKHAPYDPEAAEFLEELARALHIYGLPAHRLENVMTDVARLLGLDAQFLITPTSVIIAIGLETRLLRIDQGESDLERLADLDAILRRVKSKEITPAEGTRAVQETTSRAPRYGIPVTIIGFAVASGTAGIFFQGGWRECAGSALVGGLVGLILVFGSRHPRLARLLPALCAFVAVIVSQLMAIHVPPMFTILTTLAGLIVLIPGLTLTIAMNELAHHHLVSGTARLTGAAVTFLQLGFGAAVGWKLSPYLGDAPFAANPQPVAEWLQAVTLTVIAASLTVLFKAHPRDYVAVLLGATVAYLASRFGSEQFGPEIGMAFGAWALGSASTLIARVRNRPAAISLLPGLLLLVPGTLGIRSLQAFVRRDVPLGVETAFSMTLIAMALVTGLFLANVTLRPRPM